MGELDLNKRIQAFARLSGFMEAVAHNKQERVPKGLEKFFVKFNQLMPRLYENNGWFIEEFVRYQLAALAQSTTLENINRWVEPYRQFFEKNEFEKTIAVIMAGNIPFVDFSDFVSVLIAGHKTLLKLSSKDILFPKALIEVLLAIEPAFKPMIITTEGKITDYRFDAVIATGSDNTARYFDYYFGKYPNIIRKNRTSVAVLTGDESHEELEALADDVFLYFGLGCRNVSKLFIPQGFDLDRLFRAFYKYRDLINYNKYANNYEYNRAIMLVNKERFLDNGFVLLKQEDIALVSPTSVLYYQYYADIQRVPAYLEAYRDKIQCVVANMSVSGFQTVPLGQSQRPMLWDYPDQINVLDFLKNL